MKIYFFLRNSTLFILFDHKACLPKFTKFSPVAKILGKIWLNCEVD